MSTPNVDVLKMFDEFAHKVEKGKKFPNITRDSKITGFGIISLSMMEIIGCLEDELDITIPDEKLAILETVGDIERVVLQQLETKTH